MHGSYTWAKVRPPKNQDYFDGWVTARFGKRLFRIFFKTYTEKVWGMDTSEIARGLGGAADQEPVAVRSDRQRAEPAQGLEEDHLADR